MIITCLHDVLYAFRTFTGISFLFWRICFQTNHIETVNSLYSIESVKSKTNLSFLPFSPETLSPLRSLVHSRASPQLPTSQSCLFLFYLLALGVSGLFSSPNTSLCMEETEEEEKPIGRPLVSTNMDPRNL